MVVTRVGSSNERLSLQSNQSFSPLARYNQHVDGRLCCCCCRMRRAGGRARPLRRRAGESDRRQHAQHPQVAKLKASHVASTRRQSATILVLASVAVAVAVAAGVLRGVYGYEHGDVPSFALGLAAAMVPAVLVWALPHLVFTPRPREPRRRGRKGLAPRTPPPKPLVQ